MLAKSVLATIKGQVHRPSYVSIISPVADILLHKITLESSPTSRPSSTHQTSLSSTEILSPISARSNADIAFLQGVLSPIFTHRNPQTMAGSTLSGRNCSLNNAAHWAYAPILVGSILANLNATGIIGSKIPFPRSHSWMSFAKKTNHIRVVWSFISWKLIGFSSCGSINLVLTQMVR